MEKQSLEINFKDLLIEDDKFFLIQQKLTPLNQIFLLFAIHYPVYTIGINEAKNFPFAIPVKRSGNFTYFDEGTLMIYFILNVKSPPLFFRKVRKIVDIFFKNLNFDIFYDRERPSYYIQNRKIASLGFHYEKRRSNHGVSVHIFPNLKNFNEINQCNPKDINVTSFENEGINISIEEAKNKLKKLIKKVFNET